MTYELALFRNNASLLDQDKTKVAVLGMKPLVSWRVVAEVTKTPHLLNYFHFFDSLTPAQVMKELLRNQYKVPYNPFRGLKSFAKHPMYAY